MEINLSSFYGNQAALKLIFRLERTARLIFKTEIDIEELRYIAKEENYTTGKWEIFVPWSKADQYWQILIKDFLKGKFPEGIICVKIKGRNETDSDNNTHFQEMHHHDASILVVNDDWTGDDGTIEKIGKVLRSYKMETNNPLTYFPNVRSAIRNNKDFMNVKLPKLYQLSP